MKKITLIFTVVILSIFGFWSLASSEFKPESQEKILRHIVLLDLNDQATDSIVQNMREGLRELRENIPQIRQLEFGANIHADADYSHCLILTFDDLKSLEEYETHPMHLEFGSTYGKYVVKKTEIDYWQ